VVDQLDSESISHDFALPAGAKLFEFEIELVLGYTSFSVTYRATDRLPREAVPEAFLEEQRVMAPFRDDHIVRVRRHFETNGTGYIVLDLEQGQTLESPR
jgi:serine/threonine protein kinase